MISIGPKIVFDSKEGPKEGSGRRTRFELRAEADGFALEPDAVDIVVPGGVAFEGLKG